MLVRALAVLPGLFFLLGTYRQGREEMMPTVAAVAKGLREEIRANGGELPMGAVEEYIAAQGLEGKNATFAALYGRDKRRHWWKKNGEVLELIESAGAGPGPGSSAGAGSPGAVVPALASGEQWVAATAQQLGISERLAATVGAFSANFDLGNAHQVWAMLNAIPEIAVSGRKRLFTTILHQQGIEPPEQLTRMVNSQGDTVQPAMTTPAQSPRRYLARGGEVQILDEPDDNALTFAMALQVADQQLEKLRMAQVHEPEGIGALDRILPGLSGKIAELLFSPPRSAAGPGVPISLGGQSLTVSEETFMKMQDTETKRDAVNLVKENLPKLWQVASDLAQATDKAYDKVMGGKASDSEANFECAGCGRRVHVPAGVEVFKCRGCNTTQDVKTGQVFEEELEDQQQQEPAIPWQTCRQCQEQFRSEDYKCPSCQFDPMKLVTDAVL